MLCVIVLLLLLLWKSVLNVACWLIFNNFMKFSKDFGKNTKQTGIYLTCNMLQVRANVVIYPCLMEKKDRRTY